VEGLGRFGEAEISYSIADTPYGQDIVGQLVAAARRRQMGIGLYYNHMDWTDPAYAWDKFNMHSIRSSPSNRIPSGGRNSSSRSASNSRS